MRRVHISAPGSGGTFPPCTNDNITLALVVYDQPVTAAANLIAIEVVGGTFSYPQSPVVCPSHPTRTKSFGWIQVDFPTGPITVEVFNDKGASLGTRTVYDGQYFDITGYIMYVHEAGAIEEEADGFIVSEQSDGTGSGYPT